MKVMNTILSCLAVLAPVTVAIALLYYGKLDGVSFIGCAILGVSLAMIASVIRKD